MPAGRCRRGDAEKQLRARLGLVDGDADATASGTIDSLAIADAAKRATLVAEQNAALTDVSPPPSPTPASIHHLAAALASRPPSTAS